MNEVSKPWLTDDLDVAFYHLNRTNSELARAKLILAAYRLHKAQKRNARGRKKIPDAGKITMESFIQAATARTGHSKSTIYQRIKDAEALESLEEAAIDACLGTRLANDLGTLVRISKIPHGKIQLDLITLFDRRPPKARSELERWEAEFAPPSDEGSDDDDDGVDEVSPEEKPDLQEEEIEGPCPTPPQVPGAKEESGDTTELLLLIREALDVDSDSELLPAVKRVVGEKQELEARCESIEAELHLYKSGHLGKLYDLLNVRTAKAALQVAGEWKEAANA